jgi:hypothetical protein
MLREEIAQLDRTLDRLLSAPSEQTRREAGEDLLYLRIGWLFDLAAPGRLGTCWVSVLEYGLFLGETGAQFDCFPPVRPRWPLLDFEELVAPVRGLPYAGAKAFCEFLARRSVACGEGFHPRLPTAEEAGRALAPPPAGGDPMPRPARLEALFSGRDLAAWCQGPQPRLAMASPLSWIDGFAAGVARLFDLDAWLLTSTSLLTFLCCGMPPLRQTDADFNENWQSDRRWVERYASSLDDARQVVRALGAGDGRVEALLDFDPFHQLCGSSPLDSHRSDLLTAYGIVAGQVLRGERQAPAPAPFETGDLAEAALQLSHRGLDLSRTCGELLAAGVFGPAEHAAAELARAAVARDPASILDSARLHLAAALLARPGRGDRSAGDRSLTEGYAALVLAGERLARRIEPWEGIRLVHDR